MEKLVPQPQFAVALGFIMLKKDPDSSETKSRVLPLIKSRETLSIINVTPWSLNIKSSLLGFASKEKLYWKPEHPPPNTEILKNEPSSSINKNLIRSAAILDNLKSLEIIFVILTMMKLLSSEKI